MGLEHLTNHTEEIPKDSLERITSLAKLYKEKKEALDLANANAKIAKQQFNNVSMELIPDAMMQAGVSSFVLSNGEEVSYKEELSASVKDYDKLITFLEGRGDDGIVKVVLELGKTPQNILNKIMQGLSEKYGIMAEIKTFVHPQTLRSYFSTLCGIKKNTKAQVAIGELDEEMVSTFTFYKTKVK